MKTKELQPVTFEQAKSLKKLGFDYATDLVYASETDFHNQTQAGKVYYSRNFKNSKNGCDCAAPTVALALKWFRDGKKIANAVSIDDFGYYSRYFILDNTLYEMATHGQIESYEVAASRLLDELITILELEV